MIIKLMMEIVFPIILVIAVGGFIFNTVVDHAEKSLGSTTSHSQSSVPTSHKGMTSGQIMQPGGMERLLKKA